MHTNCSRAHVIILRKYDVYLIEHSPAHCMAFNHRTHALPAGPCCTSARFLEFDLFWVAWGSPWPYEAWQHREQGVPLQYERVDVVSFRHSMLARAAEEYQADPSFLAAFEEGHCSLVLCCLSTLHMLLRKTPGKSSSQKCRSSLPTLRSLRGLQRGTDSCCLARVKGNLKRSRYNKTPADLAIRKGHSELATLISASLQGQHAQQARTHCTSHNDHLDV